VSTAEPDVASTPMYLPTAVGLIAAFTGWWATGAAVALPVALIGAIAVAAAIEDVRTGRIPNGLVLSGIAVIACAWGFVATLDNRLMGPLAIDSLAGFVLGGAPVVFVVWLVAPRLIGGGDWKLLVVLGAMIGFVAPASASVIPMVAFGAATVAAAVRRRRHVRLGPYLAAGYLVAVAAAITLPDLFGNSYAGMMAR
jgi:Flp pilus assembly protein protease CpaA